jgi:polyphosphate kinase
MVNEALVSKAALHVRKRFARSAPPHLLFHDLEHTLDVTRTAADIAKAMGVQGRRLHLLTIAALFHDLGYMRMYDGHEEEGARQIRRFLLRHGVSERDVRQVERLIMATRVTARPRSLLERIICDADSAKAGQVDFQQRSELLRKELELVKGERIGKRQWLKENLAYLDGHTFHTPYARDRYGAQKEINLQHLRDRLQLPKRKDKPAKPMEWRFFDRDLSWLSFNDRVLQEARDPRVPLLERLKFLAIYSNNLDEFYRVRVASLRSLGKLRKVDRTALEVTPDELLERINHKALRQQQRFGRLYRGTLLPALQREGIHLLQPEELGRADLEWVRKWYKKHVAPVLRTATVRAGNAPFIEDRRLYFVGRLRPSGRSRSRRERLVLIGIPTEELGRFVELPAPEGQDRIMYLDDVMRIGLPGAFPGWKLVACHAIKLSRDAELYLEEEFADTVVDKVRKSLRKRTTGVPARFLYDPTMSRSTLRALRTLLGLKKADLVAGGRYHNFFDLFTLPVKGRSDLRDVPWPPFPHPRLHRARSVFGVISRGDLLLHFPYHDFGSVVQWIREAARDAGVERISITLYRVADGSAVCNALLEALAAGKEVTVFVEVTARFDERSNLYWGGRLEEAGARVLYSHEHLKVHCKLLLVERREGRGLRRYGYLGTGNFNEKTARLYTDTALLTCREDITAEMAEVFAHLKDRRHVPALERLLMAPLNLRAGMEALVDREIANALQGRKAAIFLKLNSLEDRALIRKLYDASNAGVQVRIIVRGICCLVPNVPGMSARVEAISIVDRFLEHVRLYSFHNGGDPVMYLASADWMTRNMDRRVEVAFPLDDPALCEELRQMLDIQWNDRVKARVIDARQTNRYLAPERGRTPVRAQERFYSLLLGRGKRRQR